MRFGHECRRQRDFLRLVVQLSQRNSGVAWTREQWFRRAIPNGHTSLYMPRLARAKTEARRSECLLEFRPSQPQFVFAQIFGARESTLAVRLKNASFGSADSKPRLELSPLSTLLVCKGRGLQLAERKRGFAAFAAATANLLAQLVRRCPKHRSLSPTVA